MDATYHIPPQQYAAIQQGLPPLPSSHNPPHDPNYRPLPPPPPQHYHNPPPSANPQYQYPPPSTHQASREHSQALGVKEEMDSSIGAIGPPPLPYSAEVAHEGRKYTLEVCQQPMRARMCGFGDKDRRPITPPPCVRLVITDLKDGKVIDTNDIDHGFYVLNVDLWSPDGTKEWNLVRHANSSPVPPPSSTYSGAGSAEPNTPVYANSPMGAGPRESYSQYSYGQPTNGIASQPPAPYSAYPPQSGYPPQHPQAQYGQNQAAYPPRPSSPGYGRGYPDGRDGYPAAYGAPRDGWQPENQRTVVSQQQQPAGGMYTRNLIGSLAASAFRLTDTNDRIGIWFVLQDLSVRTEGTFRLRFSFVNVGVPEPAVNGNGSSGAIVNTGRAPILASCFSDPFTVYSAKKFPGVVESTPLSKMFAGQGIKIPIRKDGENSKKNDDD